MGILYALDSIESITWYPLVDGKGTCRYHAKFARKGQEWIFFLKKRLINHGHKGT